MVTPWGAGLRAAGPWGSSWGYRSMEDGLSFPPDQSYIWARDAGRPTSPER